MTRIKALLAMGFVAVRRRCALAIPARAHGLRILALAAIVLLASSCFFGGTLTVFVEPITGFASISVGGEEGVNIGTCFDLEPGGLIECAINGITSGIETLTIVELITLLIILDPVVLQVPDDLTNFAGSYSHIDTSTGGPLDITAGLTTVAIDVGRTLVAEPGTQLVTVGLPAGAPTTGGFNFNLNFNFPPGTPQIEVKPIITGLVELTDGSRYFPPLLPCVESMAAAPALTVPLSGSTGVLALPPLAGLGCDGKIYNFIPGAIAPLPIPALSGWSALLFAAVLATVGFLWLVNRGT